MAFLYVDYSIPLERVHEKPKGTHVMRVTTIFLCNDGEVGESRKESR